MDAAEHFREGEALLESGCDYGCPHAGCPHEVVYVARAQAHFLAAIASAVTVTTAVAELLAARPPLDADPLLRPRLEVVRELPRSGPAPVRAPGPQTAEPLRS